MPPPMRMRAGRHRGQPDVRLEQHVRAELEPPLLRASRARCRGPASGRTPRGGRTRRWMRARFQRQRVALVPAPLLRPQLQPCGVHERGSMPPQRRLQVTVRPRAEVHPGGMRAKTEGMRLRRSLLAVTPFVLLAAASPANAAVPHTVQPGETLWSIAASNNLTTRTVAAFNGLSEDAQVVLGSTINVPTVAEGALALAGRRRPQAAAPAAAAAAPAPGAARRARLLRRAPGRHAVRPRRQRGRRDGRRWRPPTASTPPRRSSTGTVLKLPVRRPDAGARLRAAAVAARGARSRARSRRRRASAPGTSSPSRRSTASRPRSPPRSRGRRAASTTAWSPRPTPAA